MKAKSLIAIFITQLFLTNIYAQTLLTDTLLPIEQIKLDDGSYYLIFDNINNPLNTTSTDFFKKIQKASRTETSLIVTYNTSDFSISAVKTIELSKEQKFLEKYDTLAFLNFNFDNTKSFKFNERRIADELESFAAPLQTLIPLDSITIIFEYFKTLSCTNTPVCSKEPKCISYDYKTNGCNARAHWMRKILEEKFHYSCQKIFSIGNLIALNDGNCGNKCVFWGWHVAPLVETINANGEKIELVLDPSLSLQPLSKNDWVALQQSTCTSSGRTGHVTKTKIAPADIYTPNGSTDINYSSTKKLLYSFCKNCH